MDPAERKANKEKHTPRAFLDELFMEPEAACDHCSRTLREPFWLPCKHVFCKLCSDLLNVAGSTKVKCSKCLQVFDSKQMIKDKSVLAAYTGNVSKYLNVEKSPELQKNVTTTEIKIPTKVPKRQRGADSIASGGEATKRHRGRPKKQCMATVTSAADVEKCSTPPPTVEVDPDTSVKNLPFESPWTKVGTWLNKSAELKESTPPLRQVFKGKNEKLPKPLPTAKGSGAKDCSEQQQDLLLSDSGIHSSPGRKFEPKAGPSGVQNVSAISGDQSPGWSRVRRASREIQRNEQTIKSLDISGGESSKKIGVTRSNRKIGRPKLDGVAKRTAQDKTMTVSKKAAQLIATSEYEMSENNLSSKTLNISAIESNKPSGLAKDTEKLEEKLPKVGAANVAHGKVTAGSSKNLREIASPDSKLSEDKDTVEALNISGIGSCKSSALAKSIKKVGRKKLKVGAEDFACDKAIAGSSKTLQEIASPGGKPSEDEDTVEVLNVSSVESLKSLVKAGRKKLETIPGEGTQEISAAGCEISENDETLKASDITKSNRRKKIEVGTENKAQEKGVADSSKTAPGIALSGGERSENDQSLVAQNESSQKSCKSLGNTKKTKKIERKTPKADDVNVVQITHIANSGKPAQQTATTEGVKSKTKATNLKPIRSLRARKGQSCLDKPLLTSKDLETSKNANLTEPTIVKSSQNTKQNETAKFVKELIANTSSKNSVEIVSKALRKYEFYTDSDSLEDDECASDMKLPMVHQTSVHGDTIPHRISDPISEADRDFPGFPSFEQYEITSNTHKQPSLGLPKAPLLYDDISNNDSKDVSVQENDQEMPAVVKSSAKNKIASRSNVPALKKVPKDTKRKTFSLDVNTQDLAFIRVNEDSFDKRILEIANANKSIKVPTEAIGNVLMNVTNSPTKLASKVVPSKDKMDVTPEPKLSKDSTHPSNDDLIEQFRCFLEVKSEPIENPNKDFSLTDFRDLRPFIVAYKGPFVSSTGEPIPGKRVLMELDPCSVTQLKIRQNPVLENTEKLFLDEKLPSAGNKCIAEISDNSDNENLQSMVAVDPSDRNVRKVTGLVDKTLNSISIAEWEVKKCLVANKETAKEKVSLEVSDYDSFPNTIPDTMPCKILGKANLRSKPPTKDFPSQVLQLPEANVKIDKTDMSIKSKVAKVKKPQPKSSKKPYSLRRKQKIDRTNTQASVPKLTDPQASGTHRDDTHINDKPETSSKRRFNRIRTPSDSNEFEDAIPDTDIFGNDCDLPNRMSDEEPDSLEYLLDAHCRNIPSPDIETMDIEPTVTIKSQGSAVKMAASQVGMFSSPQTPDSFVNVQRMIASSDKDVAASFIRLEDTNPMVIDNDITHMEESPVRRSQTENLGDNDDDSEEICNPTPEAVNRSKIARRSVVQKPQPPFPDMTTSRISESETAGAEQAHIIYTSLSLEETKLLFQMIKMVGATKDSIFSETTTHLVAATSEEGCAQRTVKFIMAVAIGAWVVSPSWVHKCIETSSLVSESSYEARDFVFGDSPRRSRLGGGGIFRDFAFFLMPSYDGQIEESEFKMILQLAGASMVDHPSDKGNKKYLVTLTVQEDSPTQKEINECFMAEHDSLTVGHTWIHSCICSYLLRSVWTHLPDDADIPLRIRSRYPPQIFAPPTESDEDSDA